MIIFVKVFLRIIIFLNSILLYKVLRWIQIHLRTSQSKIESTKNGDSYENFHKHYHFLMSNSILCLHWKILAFNNQINYFQHVETNYKFYVLSWIVFSTEVASVKRSFLLLKKTPSIWPSTLCSVGNGRFGKKKI